MKAVALFKLLSEDLILSKKDLTPLWGLQFALHINPQKLHHLAVIKIASLNLTGVLYFTCQNGPKFE